VVVGLHCAGGTNTGFAEPLDRNTDNELCFGNLSTVFPRILNNVAQDSVFPRLCSSAAKGICLWWSLVKMWTGITYIWVQWQNIVTQHRAFGYCGGLKLLLTAWQNIGFSRRTSLFGVGFDVETTAKDRVKSMLHYTTRITYIFLVTLR
jgi:hypothetical protein